MRLKEALKKANNNKVACRKDWNINEPIAKPVMTIIDNSLVTGLVLLDKDIELTNEDMAANDWQIITYHQKNQGT